MGSRNRVGPKEGAVVFACQALAPGWRRDELTAIDHVQSALRLPWRSVPSPPRLCFLPCPMLLYGRYCLALCSSGQFNTKTTNGVAAVPLKVVRRCGWRILPTHVRRHLPRQDRAARHNPVATLFGAERAFYLPRHDSRGLMNPVAAKVAGKSSRHNYLAKSFRQ